MDKMIKVCEIFADKIGLLFNPLKSKLLYYNVDNPNTVYNYYLTLVIFTVRTSIHEKHLCDFINNNIFIFTLCITHKNMYQNGTVQMLIKLMNKTIIYKVKQYK